MGTQQIDIFIFSSLKSIFLLKFLLYPNNIFCAWKFLSTACFFSGNKVLIHNTFVLPVPVDAPSKA